MQKSKSQAEIDRVFSLVARWLKAFRGQLELFVSSSFVATGRSQDNLEAGVGSTSYMLKTG